MKPVLQIKNAGHGITPNCPNAKFQCGDVVRVRRLKHLNDVPERGVVAVIVPAGFPPEYAFADATGGARPLMITRPKRCISYLVGFEDDPIPMLLNESSLLATNEPKAKVHWVKE